MVDFTKPEYSDEYERAAAQCYREPQKLAKLKQCIADAEAMRKFICDEADAFVVRQFMDMSNAAVQASDLIEKTAGVDSVVVMLAMLQSKSTQIVAAMVAESWAKRRGIIE